MLLKCTSAYPAPVEEANLLTLPDLSHRFKVPVGLSDHTLGAEVSLTAVALGACLVEKHFTLSRQNPGPDSAFSMEPDEFTAMVRGIRTVEKTLGRVAYGTTPGQTPSLAFRRSLFVTRNMRMGDVFAAENVRAIRPADGLHPRYLRKIIGRRASRDIAFGTPLTWDLVSDSGGAS